MNAPQPLNNSFVELAKINVNEHIEKKGQFSYLSWPFAVAELRKFDPTATWQVIRFDNLPYCMTDLGAFVEVAVTVHGITLSQIHPVLDGRNKPIAKPSAFDINTSIQRCLVKAIALHGLGLYIYAGEDLPEGDKVDPPNDKKESNKSIGQADFDSLDQATQECYRRFAMDVSSLLSEDRAEEAVALIYQEQERIGKLPDGDVTLFRSALNHLFDSKERAAMKKVAELMKKAAQANQPTENA